MSDIEILARILLALGFGAILGLETETRASEGGKKSKAARDAFEAQRIGGVRTYTVIALFGAVAGVLFNSGFPVFAYLIFTGIFLIVLAAYVLNIQQRRRFGMTTEIAILITVLVGFGATTNIIALHILIILTIILTFILSQKRGISKVVQNIAHRELEDVVKFAIVAIVFLPFLANQDYYLRDFPGIANILNSLGVQSRLLDELVIINPFRLWQYVVLISGFNLLGYFANRILGKSRGLVLTGVFGGFVSSTSTMISLAIRSKKEKAQYLLRNLGGVGLIANSVSFLQILVLAASASMVFFSGVLPATLAMGAGSVLTAIWFMSRNKKEIQEDVEVKYEPYSIGPAVKFALLLTTIRILVQVANFYLGDNAFVFVTALSGTLGMDAATISLGELVAQGGITIQLALTAYLLANGVNFLAKGFYSYLQGSFGYFKIITIGLLASFVAGVAGVLLVLLDYL